MLAQHALAFGGALLGDAALVLAFALEALGALAFGPDARVLLAPVESPVESPLVAAVAVATIAALLAVALVLQALGLLAHGRRGLAALLVALRLFAALPLYLLATLPFALRLLELPGALGLLARSVLPLSGALVALAGLVMPLRIATLLVTRLLWCLSARSVTLLLGALRLATDRRLALLLARSLFALLRLARRLLAQLRRFIGTACTFLALLARLLAGAALAGVAPGFLGAFAPVVALAARSLLRHRMRHGRQREAGGDHHRQESCGRGGRHGFGSRCVPTPRSAWRQFCRVANERILRLTGRIQPLAGVIGSS